MSTKSIVLRLPESIHRQFKTLAAQEGKSIKELVLSWLREKTGQKEPDDIPDCPECKKYSGPNAVTRAAMEEPTESQPERAGKDYLAELDKEFGK